MTSPTQPTRGDYVSLRDHLESRIEAVEKSIGVAERELQIRLASMNEFREAMRDQGSKFITRTEMDAKIDAICAKIEVLEKYQNTMEGKASQSQANLALVFSLIGTILGIAGLILHMLTSS